MFNRSGIFGPDASPEDRFIPDYDLLARKIRAPRELGLRVVLPMGTFDMIHVGHARYLREARSRGGILVVGIDSDEKVRLRKGEGRPVAPQAERIEMLTHLRYVDVVAIKNTGQEKWTLIKLIRPDVLIATSETYNPEQLSALQEFCGEVVVLEPQATTTTSARIRLLQIGGLRRAISRLEEVVSVLKGEAGPS